MNKRSTAPARIVAVATLVAAFVLLLIVIGGSLGGGSEDSSGGGSGKTVQHKASRPKHVPATYEVKSGDTLISIAHETGVPVVRIQELNPEVDPQILIAGEQLKLR
jgi:LysM repeat protein